MSANAFCGTQVPEKQIPKVYLQQYPPKKKFSEILKEFGPNPTLADSVEEASREMRKVSMREADSYFL